MNKREIIEQLESTRAHCKSMIKSDELWKLDAEALDYAVNAINDCKCSFLHRFNTNNRVKVKEDLKTGEWYDGLIFNSSMEEYKGKEFNVEAISAEGYILNTRRFYFFSDEMLERAE